MGNDMKTNEKVPPGISFQGTCTMCKKTGEVRYLNSYHKTHLIPYSQIIGPYDRFCAYKAKFRMLQVFKTQPKNLIQHIYRYFTRTELPGPKDNKKEFRKLFWKSFFNYAAVMLISWAVLYGLYLLLTPVFLVLFVIIIFLKVPYQILKTVRTFTHLPNLGLTYRNNFENYWNGKIFLQDKDYKSYITRFMRYGVLAGVFAAIPAIFPAFVPEISRELSLEPVLRYIYGPISHIGLDYYTILIVLVIIFIYFTRFFVPNWTQYAPMPEDIHQEALKQEEDLLILNNSPPEEVKKEESKDIHSII